MPMSQSELKEFLAAQVSAMELAKWYEGERIHADPGEDFLKSWIADSAAEFRRRWDKDHGSH